MKLIRIIYIGSRTSHRQKRTYQYLNEISDNTTYNFSRRIAASEIIGSVVESRLSNGDKTFNDSKVVGFIDTSHSEFINLTRWSAEQKASNLELQAFADLKKEY